MKTYDHEIHMRPAMRGGEFFMRGSFDFEAADLEETDVDASATLAQGFRWYGSLGQDASGALVLRVSVGDYIMITAELGGGTVAFVNDSATGYGPQCLLARCFKAHHADRILAVAVSLLLPGKA